MNWTVNLTVSYVPCPPEHTPAWQKSMQTLMELAMNVNVDRCGRTAGGKATYRPLVQWDEEDYPPDSNYWRSCALGAAGRLSERIGFEEYCAWLDAQGEPAHWRALYDLIHEKELEHSLSSEIQINTLEGAMG